MHYAKCRTEAVRRRARRAGTLGRRDAPCSYAALLAHQTRPITLAPYPIPGMEIPDGAMVIACLGSANRV